jgi:hypothetical protein
MEVMETMLTMPPKKKYTREENFGGYSIVIGIAVVTMTLV